jgi:molybdate transport system substrate-binding protein
MWSRRARDAIVLLTMVAGGAMSGMARADMVQLYAAGSLRAAFNEVGNAFHTRFGIAVQAKYGPSGILKDEIAGGAKADVFASANMIHPQSLADAGKSGPVVLFCAQQVVRAGQARPAGYPGQSTGPNARSERQARHFHAKADPSGDYAFDVFDKAEALRPGARAVLEGKALQLTGGPASVQPPAGIWTALASNFEEKTHEPFSIEAAIRHLEARDEETLGAALRYIRQAPPQIKTPVRDAVDIRWPR